MDVSFRAKVVAPSFVQSFERQLSSMNGLHDSHRRTSISQLLNPLAAAHESASFPNPVLSPGVNGAIVGVQPHSEHEGFQTHYSNPSSFNLRAASWDQAAENQNGMKRKVENGNGARPMRNRMDPPGFLDGAMWPPHDMANLSYAPPALVPMYSDERSVSSGDFVPNNQYDHAFQEQSNASVPDINAWQTSERVSVRLAARTTLQEGVSESQAHYHLPPAFFPPSSIPYGPIQFPPLQNAKRPVPTADGASAQQLTAKKSKTREGLSGNSRRGYNAKKRSEAAQIAAQNAQLMPLVSYTQAPGDKGKENACEAPAAAATTQGAPVQTQVSRPLQPELQFARCMSNRYRSDSFPRCVSCTRRWAGDTCRFQGIRFFLKDDTKNIVGISFVEGQKPDAPCMDFPVKWNVPLQITHIRRVKRTVARALLPTLQKELGHLDIGELIRRPRESEVRATCDTCMTSIFSSSWMCRQCGREACAECFSQVQDLMDRPGASSTEIATLQSRREKHAYSNPFFLTCTKRKEHQALDFSPVSRFCKDELGQVVKDMAALLLEPDIDALPTHEHQPISTVSSNLHTDVSTFYRLDGTQSGHSAEAHLVIPNQDSTTSSNLLPLSNPPSSGLNGSAVDPSQNPHNLGSETSEIPCHDTMRFADSELTEDVFRPIWARGIPIVVTGLLAKFKISWTPEYFLEKYNAQTCLIVECQTDANKRVTVGEFFSWFGKYEGRTECWKLKDWPPSTEFKKAFPELYDDFCGAVPVPNYVRCDGVLNIASHFPSNTVAPDLGPKMYNAMASNELDGSKGSTRLHMDMADALNIMTFASLAPDGSPGTAAWDLFRADDSDKIRKFLRKKFQGTLLHDPIHSQQFYLGRTLRKQLLDEYGVKSHRVYQHPGEAVFIPAGCAHQVVNLADCVKVAVDFVSPENIDRCEKLTREFREQNQSMAWKEDVLQLRTMMWFAWLSCCRQESSD